MRKIKTTAIFVAAICALMAITSCSSTKKLEPAKKGYIETKKYRNYLKDLGFSKKEINEQRRTHRGPVLRHDGSRSDEQARAVQQGMALV